MASGAERNPRHHTQHMRQRLQEMVQHLRKDIGEVDEPQLKAMFETSAEVLLGLDKARNVSMTLRQPTYEFRLG